MFSDLAMIPSMIGYCAAAFEVGDRAPDPAIERTGRFMVSASIGLGAARRFAGCVRLLNFNPIYLGLHMKKIVVFAMVLAVFGTSAVATGDTRQLVQMPPPMIQHMLSNMRDHLLALTEILNAMGSGEYQRAADVAEQRIGLSSLKAHGASHMAPLMPAPMQDIGTRMHKAASQFSLVVQEAGADGNVKRAVAALSKVTEQCVACHAAYRAH